MDNFSDPILSIVIPARNEEHHIGRCLDSLLSMEIEKGELEIIVVDNGSTDSTVEIARDRGIRVLHVPEAQVSKLRNIGAAGTRGEFLGFVDADCIVDSRWAVNALAVLREEDPSIGAVGAPYILPEQSSWIDRTWNLIEQGSCNWIPGGNLVVPREVFRRTGGFDETLVSSEDVDFCDRLRREGYPIRINRKMEVTHLKGTPTLLGFIRRQEWHGVGVWQRVLRSFPCINASNIKVILFTLAMLGAMTMLFLEISSQLLHGTWHGGAIALWAGAVCTPPLAMSLRSVLFHQKAVYFLPLFLLSFLFGIARSYSMMKYCTYKLTDRKFR